ncbi:MAG: hypothetical protein EOO90_16200 [Pedobacter sp.]|nr:MAG: hypothetical protein EOO90_16200 [Pedobacter sp.]
MPKNPQPSDEVQLNIETVTPDTEKDVKPTVQPQGQKPEKEDAAAEQENEEPVKQQETSGNDGEESEVEESDDTNDVSGGEEKGDDARDQIETVSP